MSIFKKATFATALAATALVTTTPAMARDYHRGGGDNTAAVAIGAGILGLAVGAIVASSSRNHDRYRDDRYDDRYADSGYVYSSPAYTSDWRYRDGYYWDRDGRRHDRDEYYRYRNYDSRYGYNGNYADRRRGY